MNIQKIDQVRLFSIAENAITIYIIELKKFIFNNYTVYFEFFFDYIFDLSNKIVKAFFH